VKIVHGFNRGGDVEPSPVWRVAHLLERLGSIDASCSPDALVRVLTGTPSLFETVLPTRAEMTAAHAELRKLLRRKPTVKAAGRPRGSRPIPPVTFTRHDLAVYLEAREFMRELRKDFPAEDGGIAAYPRTAAAAILEFIGGGQTHRRRVKAFLRHPEQLLRFLIKVRLGISERETRRLLPALRRNAKQTGLL
jgi:hypothetical protein